MGNLEQIPVPTAIPTTREQTQKKQSSYSGTTCFLLIEGTVVQAAMSAKSQGTEYTGSSVSAAPSVTIHLDGNRPHSTTPA
jgi:hypothetical protein